MQLIKIANDDIIQLNMSAFKKKKQVPETISDLSKKLNMLLGLGSNKVISEPTQKGRLTKQLILACASFWDSKQRVDKIKSLILKEQELKQFNDTDDFKVDELHSIELLSLSKNEIIHLHPLAGLDTLICLNINNNKVYDLSPLVELTNLEELYAANNQINLLDGLAGLKKMHILNLYNNRISRLDESVKILNGLEDLEELDVELNPIYSAASRSHFLNLFKIVRLNGELILQEERDGTGPMAESCIVMPSAKFRDTHTSFFNTKNKATIDEDRLPSSHSSSSRGTKPQRNKNQMMKKLMELENKYFEIDDRFQDEIVRNVQLKSEFHRKVMLKRELERKKEESEEKESEIRQMKRKVKALKENLFGNQKQGNRKGELLRELFQLEMLSEKKKEDTIQGGKDFNIKSNHQLWVRKFDFDEEIVIGDDGQYLTEEDAELDMLLSSNTSAIEQLKRELREMAN